MGINLIILVVGALATVATALGNSELLTARRPIISLTTSDHFDFFFLLTTVDFVFSSFELSSWTPEPLCHDTLSMCPETSQYISHIFCRCCMSVAGVVYVTTGRISESTGAQCKDVLILKKIKPTLGVY